jgi:hypothetical protein
LPSFLARVEQTQAKMNIAQTFTWAQGSECLLSRLCFLNLFETKANRPSIEIGDWGLGKSVKGGEAVRSHAQTYKLSAWFIKPIDSEILPLVIFFHYEG